MVKCTCNQHVHNAHRGRNPLRLDPTRSITLRKSFIREFNRRFNRLKADIRGLVDMEDAFGLRDRVHTFRNEAVTNKRFEFQTTSEQVRSFEAWLATRIDDVILDGGADPAEGYWRAFTEEGYRKGAGRSFNDVRGTAGTAGITEAGFAEGAAEAFISGSKNEFLRSAFANPETTDKLKTLAGRTFTDLKGVSSQMSSQISRILVDGLSRGDNPKVIARRLTDAVDGIGKVRAKMIAQTEIIRAHAEGQLDSLESLGLEKVTVMVEWSTAGDDRVCPLCAALDGIVMTIKEARGLIPRHPNCLPGDSLVTPGGRITAVSKRWFYGDMIVITAASGRVLSCTPNHPVLTDGGWVAAELLNLDSKVVRNGSREWEEGLGDGENENVPTSIHDVVESFLSSSEVMSRPVPLTTEDFHGDGAESKVAIIGTDGRLSGHVDSTAGHCPLHGEFDSGVVSAVGLSSGGPLTLAGETADTTEGSPVSSGDLVGSCPVVHIAPLDGFSLGSRAERDAALSEPSVNDASADTQFLADLVSGLPADVFLDDVVHVERNAVNCHVYNLQTENEWYTANGIITHNCRCAFTPANVGEAVRPGSRDQKSVEQAIDDSVRAEMPKGRMVGGKRRFKDPATGLYTRKRPTRTLKEQKRKTTWMGADRRIAKKRPAAFTTEPEGPARVRPVDKKPIAPKQPKLKPRGKQPELTDLGMQGGEKFTTSPDKPVSRKAEKIPKRPKPKRKATPQRAKPTKAAPARKPEEKKIPPAKKTPLTPKADVKSRQAAEDYTTDSFQKINKGLRDGKIVDKRIVAGTDKYLKDAPKFKGDTVRSFNVTAKEKQEILGQLKKGKIADKAFVSTAKVPTLTDKIALETGNMPADRIVFRMKGKSGADISDISLNPAEGEVLFGRNTQFRVTGFTETKSGGIIADLEEIVK